MLPWARYHRRKLALASSPLCLVPQLKPQARSLRQIDPLPLLFLVFTVLVKSLIAESPAVAA